MKTHLRQLWAAAVIPFHHQDVSWWTLYIYHIYQPLRSGRIWHKVNFWIQSCSFSYTSCLTKAEEPSLPYYLPIAGERIGFIPFPRVLALYEMQSVSSRIWTCVAVSISYDDNHYTTGSSLNIVHLYLIWTLLQFHSLSHELLGYFYHQYNIINSLHCNL